ncbi:ATP-binding protein [Streptomyces sp. CBMA29]|uniref:ATP-binding protein n=1 Tax=Streptomyces sp. CBMA29 TaxID=1896314 RepID=UPI001661F657|nr:ATP-binding protein [Streptomyces sp. CBMA29]MBD0735287.1 hypothetical protein [Streptomyces sp. CBMA29]
MKGEHVESPYGFRVPSDEACVAAARHRIIDVVHGWEVGLPEGDFDDLELLSSEVITNAVRYTRAPCAVVVRWTGVRVRVEVTDADPVRPQPRDASPEAETGRGLLLVETLAADWGSMPDPAGKVVWFEVGPPNPETPTPDRQLTEQVRAALPFTPPAVHPAHRRQPRHFSLSVAAGATGQ